MAQSLKLFIAFNRSKFHIIKVTNRILANPSEFSDLVALIEDEDTFIAQNAAWVMSDVVKENKQLVIPFMDKLYAIISKTKIDGIKRNILRVWQWISISANMQYDIANLCLQYLQSKKETVAVKAFSLTVLQNLMPYMPELKEEILFEIEKQMPNSTAAFKYRAEAFITFVNKFR